MESNTREETEFVSALEAVSLPHVDTPHFKAELKAKLLAEAARRAQPVRPARAASVVRPPWWRYALVAAALLMVLTWQVLPAPLPAFAYLEIEVNPGVRLTLNARGQVIGVEPIGEAASLALGNLNLRRQSASEAVAKILERWHRAGLLEAAGHVWLIASPIGEVRPEDIKELLTQAEEAASTHGQRLLARPPVTYGLVVDRERYDIAKQAALRPSQYVRVARAGVSAGGMRELVAAGARLQAIGKIPGGRLREFTELIAELLELGLAEDEAVRLIETLLVGERSMERLARRMERVIERVEEGQALGDAVKELQKGNGRLDDNDEPEDDDGEESEDNGTDGRGQGPGSGYGPGRGDKREEARDNAGDDSEQRTPGPGNERGDEGNGESGSGPSEARDGNDATERDAQEKRGNGRGQGPGREALPEPPDEEQAENEDEGEGN